MSMRRTLSALAALLLVLQSPAVARPRQDDAGRMAFSLGGQAVSGHGLVGVAEFRANLGLAEFGAKLMAPPASPLSFFTADMDVAFVGHTARYLPIDLMPVMGIGGATLMRDVPAAKGTGTTTDVNVYLYMPVGLRYAFLVSGVGLQAEAMYHFPAVYVWQGTSDPARWHLGLDAHLGTLLVGGFYELGAVYNGPGVRVGLAL